MIFWEALNSLGLAIVSFILYLVLRQLGVILNRIGPTGARTTLDGPRIGENILAQFTELRMKQHASPEKAKLLIFGADSCSVCELVKKGARELVKTWAKDAEIFIIYDSSENTQPSDFTKWPDGLLFKYDSQWRKLAGVSFVPFAVVTNNEGIVIGKGLVNGISHLESLLELEKMQSANIKN